jgi:hypothetical protein
VDRIERLYENLIWMKNSEIARYWAARELTTLEPAAELFSVTLKAPFACPAFTVRVDKHFEAPPRLVHGQTHRPLAEVKGPLALRSNSWCRGAGDEDMTICIDLPRGESRLDLAAV